jgi:hypothetical protein
VQDKEHALRRFPWAREEGQRWRARHEAFGHEGYRRTAEQLEEEVKELERITGIGA